MPMLYLQDMRDNGKCPPSERLWTRVDQNCSWYAEYMHFGNTPVTVTSARKSCKEFGGVLAAPDEDKEIQCILELAPDSLLDFWTAWTDEKREGIYRAYMHPPGHSYLTNNFAHWSLGEPEVNPDKADREDCLYFQRSTKGFADTPCADSRKFVCVIYEDDY
ncbi:uncharacterized protein LOC134853029 isoform X2 [Symsagittifera roscoffensis]|uniref:uncharacterized protein LOC134853029 isoform X2 n=1 Tax=Symsagittifera roscoffensis TaxID=84072 RepID=UPI00307BFDD7